MFDLYRTGQIPVPPYYALHPPVYYGQNQYQNYGLTPFAYPYTWWQQNSVGYPGPLTAPPAANGPAISVPPRRTPIINSFVVGVEKDADPRLIHNPHVPGQEAVAGVARVIDNPYYKPTERLAESQAATR